MTEITEGEKPCGCPWCNTIPTFVRISEWGDAGLLQCENDDCEVRPRGAAHDDEAKAIAAWNRRSRDAAAEKMAAAAKKLRNEVSGLEAFERGVRSEIGNANWSVLKLRRDELDEALSTFTGSKGQ